MRGGSFFGKITGAIVEALVFGLVFNVVNWLFRRWEENYQRGQAQADQQAQPGEPTEA